MDGTVIAGGDGLPDIVVRPERGRLVRPERIDDVEFGTLFTPNMFRMRWVEGRWQDACIEPVQDLRLHPGATVLHYAQSVFEGMKAYRHPSGDIVLFRPEMNIARMNASAMRLEMPQIPPDFMLKAIAALVEVERDQIPEPPGTLYIRPTLIGTAPQVKVAASREYLFYILTLVSGPYFRGTSGRDAGAVSVFVAQDRSRAGWGGTGCVKAGANYAGTLEITTKARQFQCGQVLFLEAREAPLRERRVEEMGGMNVFFVRDGALFTPAMRGTILPGITRDTLLRIAQADGIAVHEQDIPFGWVEDGLADGSISEVFACGTAAVVTGIGRFRLEDGREFKPSAATPGPVTNRLFERICGIQSGRRPDEFGWLRKVC
jgi:branched-chain amino acid aminotransferase